MEPNNPHLVKTYETWARLQRRRNEVGFELDGENLHIADVVAVAYHGTEIRLTSRRDVIQGLCDSVDVLVGHLERGDYIYGVNTGFGGNADSRTDSVIELQAALMQLTQSGILSPSPDGFAPKEASPAPWVRATIAVRCNATLRGHSAVSLPVLEAMVRLHKHKLVPVVPLRGSVSASGDLMPLAYITGAIEGNPDILVMDKTGRVHPAPQALALAGIPPVKLGPKEGLGMINGTASSAALGALVVNHANNLAFLTQALTAIAVEGLRGSVESFHPFVAQTRPHPGQIECARNIAFFIGESYLARDVHTPKDRKRQDALAQDRYALRSAPQWIGPQLEDLLLAERQITVELNSSCDNPLVDATTGDILYGCNFQAASVTSAMEKTRLSLQMLGRLLFSQLTELVDPTLSGGLPSCLAADNPSLSFTMKGVDINMAAYMAELSYLANPMSSHVQAAEMHNQSVNSMALASARMSMQAVDILTMMCACSLYAGCQALDLRTLHETFKRNAIDALVAATADSLGASMRPEDRDSLRSALEYRMAVSWDSTGKLDLYERCQLLVETAALPIVLDRVNDAPANRVLDWKRMAVDLVYRIWRETFDAFCAKQHTPDLLGRGSYVIYRFVRETLGVPFHQGFVEHPSAAAADTGGRVKKTVGGWISIIHNAIETGEIYSPLMALMVEDTSGSACNANSTARL